MSEIKYNRTEYIDGLNYDGTMLITESSFKAEVKAAKKADAQLFSYQDGWSFSYQDGWSLDNAKGDIVVVAFKDADENHIKRVYKKQPVAVF